MFEIRWVILLSRISSRTGAASLTKNWTLRLYIPRMFVQAFYTHVSLIPSQLWNKTKKKKNVPTFLGSHPWHFWSVDKISLLFIVNKAAPESVFLTAARVLTSHRFSFWDGSIHLCSQFWTVQRWRNTIFGVEIQVNLGCCVSYKGKRDKSAGRTDTSDLKCTL